MKENKKSWHLSHFCLIFFTTLLCSFLFKKFSTGFFFTGSNVFSGAIALVLLASIVVSVNTTDLLNAVIRVLAPCIFVYLFHSASDQSSLVGTLITRASFPHLILVLGAAVVSIYLTKDKEQSAKTDSNNVIDKEVRAEKVEEPGDTFDRIVGQSHVITALREISKITKSGIRLGKKEAPHAVLLFLGPTGVGKTEAARALAEEVYGSKDALIRFDMGQFNDASQANRFYGPPPGYAGFEQGGQLTRAVLKKPNSVVLLDEMEKADPKIWDAFLPVFDEGYIVDGSSNQKVDMTNTIIVLTSNILAEDSDLNQSKAIEVKEKVSALGVFRPELLGRINEILVFNSLSRDSIIEILKRRLDAALWNLSDQGYKIEVTEQTVNSLVDEVQKAKFGVRQIDDVVRAFLRKRVSELKKQ